MKLWQGENYNDDRLFILDLQLVQKGKEETWAVVTRRNVKRLPPFRIDDFVTKKEAVEFVRKIEPTTPRISQGGKPPEAPLSYEKYVAALKQEGLVSAMELFEKQLGFPGKVCIQEITDDEIGKS